MRQWRLFRVGDVQILQWCRVRERGGVFVQLLRRWILLRKHLHEYLHGVFGSQKRWRIEWRVRTDCCEYRSRQ